MRIGGFALVLCAALSGASSAWASTERIAVLVANHDGGPGLPALRYPAADGDRLASVLVDLGRFSPRDIIEVTDGDADDVLHTLSEVERRIDEVKARGDDVVFLFYYSGHAQNGVLRMGRSSLRMDVLRERLERSAADVRLAFIDSCGAGAMNRAKGGTLAPAFVVAVDPGLATTGQVIITSSSADEVSQESDDIQGSFFTHFLATGLRGDADRDGDGRVTLNEVYAYAYGRTVAATSGTRAGAQHPTYSYDLRGAGDVILTEPQGAALTIHFPEALEGRYFVVDTDRQLFVAEVDKASGAASKISLPQGQYAIKKRLEDHLLLQRVPPRQKGDFVVNDMTMEQVSFANDYAKGTPIASATIARDLDWSLSLGVGAHVPLDAADNGNTFPALPFVSVAARSQGLFNPHVVVGADVLYGNVTTTRIDPDFALVLGTDRVAFTQHALSLGAQLLWQERFFDDAVFVAGGVRVAGIYYYADFAEIAGHADQQDLRFMPGLAGVAGWNFAEHFHAELQARAHYLPYDLDGQLHHIAVVETLLSAWTDF